MGDLRDEKFDDRGREDRRIVLNKHWKCLAESAPEPLQLCQVRLLHSAAFEARWVADKGVFISEELGVLCAPAKDTFWLGES